MYKMLSQVSQGHVTENSSKLASYARLACKYNTQYTLVTKNCPLAYYRVHYVA